MREKRKFKASHFENIQELIASCIIWIKTDDYDAYCRFFDMGAMEELIKELNNLKEIEKSHKEENGKLRVKLTKQEKMIEYMVNWINDHEDPFEGCHENEKCGDDYISCEQCIKQYFEKKAEESE